MAGLHWKPFLCASDNHGDHADKETLKRFFEFAADFKPVHRIHLGDLFDFRPLRRGAGADERAERIEADVVAGQSFLEKFQPDTLLLGNHDARLWEAVQSNDGMVATCAAQMLKSFQGDGYGPPQIGGPLKKVGVKRILPYHRKKGVYHMGGINFLHGFRSTMYPAKAHSESYGPSCISGHVHKYDVHIPRHISGGIAISAPCMADLDMSYLDRYVAALAHDNGWIFGVVNERTGKHEAWCVRRQQDDNQWIDPRARWT